jgi:hypothetical protein
MTCDLLVGWLDSDTVAQVVCRCGSSGVAATNLRVVLKPRSGSVLFGNLLRSIPLSSSSFSQYLRRSTKFWSLACRLCLFRGGRKGLKTQSALCLTHAPQGLFRSHLKESVSAHRKAPICDVVRAVSGIGRGPRKPHRYQGHGVIIHPSFKMKKRTENMAVRV